VKFTPRRIREEVNVSREHPLKEFFVLVLGLSAAFVAVFVMLGLVLDYVVPHIDPELEDHLGSVYLAAFEVDDERTAAEERLQALLDRLVARLDEPGREYRVHIVPSGEVNALALPGGHIVVLSGLVKGADSENELVMVLGHELGHFLERDHLQGMGRGLVVIFLSTLLFGTDNPLSRLTMALLGSAEMQFSQSQERQADERGLGLLMGEYGHAGGATTFFERMAEKEKGKELLSLFSTHPFPQERIRAIEETIRERGYPVREASPLEESLILPE
jgi:predicted Zn-dependent protease